MSLDGFPARLPTTARQMRRNTPLMRHMGAPRTAAFALHERVFDLAESTVRILFGRPWPVFMVERTGPRKVVPPRSSPNRLSGQQGTGRPHRLVYEGSSPSHTAQRFRHRLRDVRRNAGVRRAALQLEHRRGLHREAAGVGPTAIVEALGISRTSVHRAVSQIRS